MNKTCAACKEKPFYKNKTFIVSLVLIAVALLSYLIPVLAPLRQTLFMYIKKIWWAVLFGLILGGVIDHYIPREYISFLLAKPRRRTILYSVILGFLMSACSHGILALSIQLHKKGASGPAVVAFLLASPWANITLTIMLIGFFGLKGFYIIGSAILIALITGFIFQFLQARGLIETNPHSLDIDKDFSIQKDISRRFSEYKNSFGFSTITSDIRAIAAGTVALGNMVLWWILLGIGIASVAGAYVPAGIFQNYMGATLAGLLITLAVATIIEVCSEGSAPMAFELFRQTGALGNSFVFLMAGVVTDYTEIGLLWHNVGKKTALWLPVVAVPQVLFLGWLANILFK